MFDDRDSAPSLTPGQVVDGKYRVEQVLGEGAMGVVYEATHLHLGERVAIKVLGAGRDDPVMRQRLLREARAGMGIQSEHVARVMDVGFLESGEPFIAMELLQGSDLGRILERRGPLPPEEATDLVLQATEALVEAHARGIVHRDLKLGNLFVTRRVDGSPLVKVLDFGISKVPVEKSPQDLSLTESQHVLGSPLYMSPEQVRSSKSVDRRSDIWSLGVILYKLLSNREPFDGETFSSLCAAIAADPPRPLREHAPGVPQGLERVVLRCLEKEPDRRYAGAGDLAAALAPFATDAGRLSAQRAVALSRPPSESPPPAERAVAAGAPVLESSGTTPTAWGSGDRDRRARRSVVLAASIASVATAAMVLVVVSIRDRAGAAPAPPPASASTTVVSPRPPASSTPAASDPAPASSAVAAAGPANTQSPAAPPGPDAGTHATGHPGGGTPWPRNNPRPSDDPALDKRN